MWTRKSGAVVLGVSVVLAVPFAFMPAIDAHGAMGRTRTADTGLYRVPSGAMEPTLQIGSIVTVVADPHPALGDIVVFHPPSGAPEELCGDTPRNGAACDQPTKVDSSETYIKRIVGLPGDTIKIIDGRVYRGGEIEKAPYASFAGCTATVADCNFPTPIKIPVGSYFTIGDNRDYSDDSRFWGPIPKAWIVGRANTVPGNVHALPHASARRRFAQAPGFRPVAIGRRAREAMIRRRRATYARLRR